MSLITLFFVMAIIFTAIAVISGILITRALDSRGFKSPLPLLNLYILLNLARYHEITLKETGKVGPLFYTSVIPINLALFFTLAALALYTL